jgi:hypothetical protein
MTTGRRVLIPDPVQQIRQPRLPVRGRPFDIQQPRQPARQVELFPQPRDTRSGTSCPYTPMNTYISLRQVRPVHLRRRIRPGPASNSTGGRSRSSAQRAAAVHDHRRQLNGDSHRFARPLRSSPHRVDPCHA